MGVAKSLKRQLGKVKKLSKKPTEGQEKIEPAVKEQRAYAKGQAKAAAATALTAAVVGKMSLDEMRQRLKNETDEKNRAVLRAGIEKALREIAVEENKKAKGGMPKKYNKGGYANCGASMKATQKSTKMAYGGMARKK